MSQKRMTSAEFRSSPGKDSRYADEIIRLCRLEKRPVPVTELRFKPPRRWKFDLAWPDLMLAVEIEGGLWVRGRHNRAEGFIKDCEKYNEAEILGWTVIRIPTDWFSNGLAMRYVRRALEAK